MDLSGIQLSSHKKYPVPTGLTSDRRDVLSVLDAYGGDNGELRAVLQYIYQSVTAKSCDKAFAGLLEKIAITEMHHLDALGGVIAALGGTPVYTNYAGRFFCASTINYGDTLKQMLQANVAAEEAAISGYKKILSCAENDCLAPLIRSILEDEEEHLNIFTTLFKQVLFES